MEQQSLETDYSVAQKTTEILKKELRDAEEKYQRAEAAKGALERTNAELVSTCNSLRNDLSKLGGINQFSYL